MNTALNIHREFMGRMGTTGMMISHSINEARNEAQKRNKEQSKGIDEQMAKKARRTAQDKINAIYANKELSAKARTRRVGQVLDSHKGGK